MKQLPMTPELAALIQKAVGTDVDPTHFAVFETIALNTLPLPGKNGSIFERAVVDPLTLMQMVEHVNNGNHLPLIAQHDQGRVPHGRFFHAGLNYGEDGPELRALFYLDQTEETLIAKLNAGSLDEVSVSFLSSQFLCSECGWDYMAEGSAANFSTRTCEHGHTIGEDGVHARMVGLSQFIELSLVAIGGADKPKIVGKSQSLLAPASALRLAANGFEPDAWVVHASRGNEKMTDTTKLIADLTAATSSVAVLTHEKGQLTASLATVTGERDTARAELATANETIATLTSERDTALQRPDASVQTELNEAIALLQGQVNNLLVALGKDKLEGDAMPTKVAELKAKVTELNADLTAALPEPGGRSRGTGASEPGTATLSASAFQARK